METLSSMRERQFNQRIIDGYFRRRAAGGRSAFARGMDYALLRLILFGGAYLYFASVTGKRLPSLLLALIVLLLCMVVLKIAREIRLERFTLRERQRIAALLTGERLLLCSKAAFAALARPLCGADETPLLLPCMGKATGDAVLSAIRESGAKKQMVLFAAWGFTCEARELAGRQGERVRLGDGQALHTAAKQAGLSPDPEQVEDYILQQEKQRKAEKVRHTSMAFMPGQGKKYLLTGLALAALSFLTRYGLYYRMMAGLCMGLAGAHLLTGRNRSAFSE